MTRNRTLAVLLLLLALAGCGGAGAGANKDVATRVDPAATLPPGGRQLKGLIAGHDVQAPDGRYSFRVPADWIAMESPLAEVSYRSTDLGAGLQMNIAREDLTQIQRPQAYAEAARKEVSSIYRNVLSLSLSPVRISNRDAYRWIYTATVNNVEHYYYQLFVVDGGQGFVMTGVAPIGVDFDATQAVFDSIAGSIAFGRG